MKPNSVAIDGLATESIKLPAKVASMLKSEAEKNQLSIPELLLQWLDEQADARESAAVMKRIKDGQEKTSSWSEARKRLMDAP